MSAWHDARVTHPTERDFYIVVQDRGHVTTMYWDDGWNCHHSEITGELVDDYAFTDVAFWMELPAPPAGFRKVSPCRYVPEGGL